MLKSTLSLTCQEITVLYNDFPALKNVTLAAQGNTIAVIGENGAGKSTLIKTILNLQPPLSGSLKVSFTAQETNQSDQATELALVPHKHMAFCPEEGSVFSDITVESYIKFWCRLKKNDPLYYLNQGAYLIERLDIQPLLTHKGQALSKGQRRRVQTALCFLIGPKLFLCDEPFDGLDVMRTHQLVRLIKDHRKEMGFVISSHRMDVVERISDYVLVLHQGTVKTAGTSQEVAQALAGEELTITIGGTTNETKRFFKLMTSTYPGCYFSKKSENSFSVVGKEILQSIVTTLAQEAQIELQSLSTRVPSLVDAMTYHLQTNLNSSHESIS